MHTVSIWTTIIALAAFCILLGYAHIVIAVVCAVDRADPFCDYRLKGVYMLFGIVVLLLIEFLFVAEHDPEFDAKKLGSLRSKLTSPRLLARSTVRALRHRETPHRKKTLGVIVGLLLTIVGYIGLVYAAHIAFVDM